MHGQRKRKQQIKKKLKKVIKRKRRDNLKFPGLDPRYNLLTRREEIEDISSYINKLSEKEKEWLNRFVEEEINANFQHPGRKFNKSKRARREIYNKNNARNRDIFTRAKAQNKLTGIDELKWGKDYDD